MNCNLKNNWDKNTKRKISLFYCNQMHSNNKEDKSAIKISYIDTYDLPIKVNI